MDLVELIKNSGEAHTSEAAQAAETSTNECAKGDQGQEIAGAWQDFGNSYWIANGRCYWRQGDSGTTASYACGSKYVKYHVPSPGFAISVQGQCGPGKPYYRFGY